LFLTAVFGRRPETALIAFHHDHEALIGVDPLVDVLCRRIDIGLPLPGFTLSPELSFFPADFTVRWRLSHAR
jgi:hypothetical protein